MSATNWVYDKFMSNKLRKYSVRLSQADTELRYEHFYTTENKSTTASSYWFSNMGTELGH